MKTSRTWLQKYFDTELPSSEVIADALTFHAAEIEEIKGDMLDVKVLPDRAAYMLSHRGVAVEIAASLDIPLSTDPLKTPIPEYPSTDAISIDIEDHAACLRYMAALVRGVKVGPSPAWLVEALESVGQRSINNVVDATNYVMLNIGQPLHAFDAKKLTERGETYAIQIRGALEGEKITTLSGEEYLLPESTLLIVDQHGDQAIGIAGVKGGMAAAIDESTTDIIIESASFDGTMVRKTAQALKLFTDASARFQNKPSPALAAYGLRDVITLITDIAGGELIGVVDRYEAADDIRPVSASLREINALLGSSFTLDEVRRALTRLAFSYTETEDTFTILPSFERQDLVRSEDLIEEIGRILGYENIPSVELPLQITAPDQKRYRGIECIKDFLIERGYSEVSTQSFATQGDIALANPLREDFPWLRASLLPNLEEALTRAVAHAPRLVGPDTDVRLFEIGNVFTKDGEVLLLSMGAKALEGTLPDSLIRDHVATLEQELFAQPGLARFSLDGTLAELNLSKVNLDTLGDDYAPVSVHLGSYRSFSQYPYALRDVAVWTPAGTEESEVSTCILAAAGDLLVRIDLFDRFEKEDRISYAFRLVFESSARTLTDADLDPAMTRISDALDAREGYQVR